MLRCPKIEHRLGFVFCRPFAEAKKDRIPVGETFLSDPTASCVGGYGLKEKDVLSFTTLVYLTPSARCFIFSLNRSSVSPTDLGVMEPYRSRDALGQLTVDASSPLRW